MAAAPYLHTDTFRIVMGEVDVAQIHFTAIYRWMDRGLSELLAAIGHPFTRVLAEGPGIPIVDSRCRFRRRLLLDDEIALHTWVTGIGRTSFRTRHHFLRDGELAAEGELVHVCVNRGTREPIPVPDWLRAVAFPDDAVPYAAG
ncbi:MAG: thioesterase family protein [Actinomycetota bacterium]